MVSIYELGCSTAVVTCDQRHLRLRDQILPLEHYMRLTMLCTNLPVVRIGQGCCFHHPQYGNT